jgi:hypothetical protein
MRFAQNSWSDWSQPGLEGDGVNPDLMGYAEGTLGTNSVSIGANAQINLCKMNWHPTPPNYGGIASFSYVGNTGASGQTGYIWVPDPDLRAFATATGLSNVNFPVELRAFSAHLEGRVVVLTWTTESEKNNKGFDVERRYAHAENNFSAWKRIDFVRGKGTTAQRTEYMTIDNEEHRTGFYQYRLRQIDTDGTYTFSQIVEVQIAVPNDELLLDQNYPNPVGTRSAYGMETTIRFSLPASETDEGTPAQLHVYDVLGRLVRTLTSGVMAAGTQIIQFDVSSLPSGTYLYQLRSAAETRSRFLTVLN